MTKFDQESMMALFAQPASDGKFSGGTLAHLNRLGRTRPVVFLSFPPKAAGTYFRTAIGAAVGGQLVRAVHAQGGRDGTPYLPTFLMYYCGGVCTGPMIAHVHMQALAANRNFIEALELKPIVMLRSIPDMLASYWDMLEADPQARLDGLNCQIPSNFVEMSKDEKADFLVDILGPWYASYFATWQSYSDEAPGRVCALTYDEFKADPAATMMKALAHAGLPQPREVCQKALDKVWAARNTFRFNKGTKGRGGQYFGDRHRDRLARMLGYYPQLKDRAGMLLETSGEVPLRQAG
jgi:hypothetical protein